MAQDQLVTAPAGEIFNEAVRLLREYTGRGPTKAKTTIARDLVTIILGDILTKGERSLSDEGRVDLVLEVRHAYEQAMRDELVAVVEGRDWP